MQTESKRIEGSQAAPTRVRAGKEIVKKPGLTPNLIAYEQVYRSFDWQEAKKEIDYLSGGKLNAAYNALDRQLTNGRRNKVALYAVDAHEHLRKYTFQELADMTNRLGNVLRSLGVNRGDRVFVYLPRIPELYAATLAIAKLGAVVGPLFSAFGPDALRDRLLDSEAKIVITDRSLKTKIDEVRQQLPDLEHLIIVGADPQALRQGELSYEKLVEHASDILECQ